MNPTEGLRILTPSFFFQPETPQKRRKTSEEPTDETAEKQQPIIKQLENCSAKVESANNLQKQKSDLKALIARTVSELLKALEFDSPSGSGADQ